MIELHIDLGRDYDVSEMRELNQQEMAILKHRIKL